MADILLYLLNRIYKKQSSDLELLQKELAELAAMSIESTTRIFTKFKNEGLISMDGKYIEILQPNKILEIRKKVN